MDEERKSQAEKNLNIEYKASAQVVQTI